MQGKIASRRINKGRGAISPCMLMLVYQILITCGVFGLLAHLLLNLFVFRRPHVFGSRLPSKISVLIPARNEEACIGACLESLTQQNAELYEILVLDDHSEDGTADIIEEWCQRDSRVHRLSGKDLPAGWTGKAWACHQLSEQASGIALVFTDADTMHHPDSIGAALCTLLLKDADMISLWPYQRTQTVAEKLVVPFVHILLLVFLPHWMPGRWRSLGAANGQFIAFLRGGYDEIGGHAAVKNHLVEDVSLARLAKVAGLKVINADGSRLVTCRMYECLADIWEGFSKNLRAGCDGSVFAFLMLQGIQCFCLFLPFLWFVIGLVSCAEWLPWVALQLIGIYLIRFLLVWRVKHSIRGAILHPFGQVLELCIALNSWLQFSQGEMTWKGRTYSAN
ncbi:MAG: glycosyltransferase [Verrucomicrobiota bacterium]